MGTVITLPAWMKSVKKLYNTTTGGTMTPVDVALAFALTIRLHGTTDALRKTAWNITDKVCRQQKPGMKRLAKSSDDDVVWEATTKIVNRVTDMLNIFPGQEIPLVPFEEPKEPEADEADILCLLEEIANEVANPKKICEEVLYLAEQLPQHQRAGLYLIGGSKNPRAVIMAMLRTKEAKSIGRDDKHA
ncbi:hypothetical protein D3C76_27550 [compost metagenome]